MYLVIHSVFQMPLNYDQSVIKFNSAYHPIFPSMIDILVYLKKPKQTFFVLVSKAS